MPEQTKLKLSPALERGVRILDAVARSKSYLGLSDLSRELNIAKSSVHTLCQTLVEKNLLIRRPDQSFQLGPHVMRWANAFKQQLDVATEFTTIWDQHTKLPGATITLSVLEDKEVVYIAARNSDVSHSLIDFRVGMRLPAAFTATGKAFLSYMSDFEVRQLYSNGLPDPRTPKSVKTLESLLLELHDIRVKGYSYDNEQVAEGIVCFGAPVLDSRNRPIAGIAASFLKERLNEILMEHIVCDVQLIAAQLSRRMGADLLI